MKTVKEKHAETERNSPCHSQNYGVSVSMLFRWKTALYDPEALDSPALYIAQSYVVFANNHRQDTNATLI